MNIDKTSLLLRGLLLGVLVPQAALASTDNYVEIHVDSSLLANAVRRALISNSDFCPQQIPCPGSPSTTCVVDHLVVGAPGTWSRASGSSNVAVNSFTTLSMHPVRYTQPVTAHVKTMTCANNPSCSTTTTHPVSLTYQLYSGADADLCVQSVGSSPLPGGITPPQTSLCLGLSLDEVLALSGFTSGSVSGSALSLAADGSRIALRTEYGRAQASYDSARIAAWQSFLDGALNNNGAADQWSTFVHQSLIRAAFKSRLVEALEGVPGLDINTSVSTGWTSLGNAGGRAVLTFDGTLTDTLCPNSIDIDDVTLSVDTGINSAHTGLLGQGSLNWNPSDWDVFVCGMAFGGPIGAVVMAGVADGMDIDLSGLGDGCQATGDATFACDQATHPLMVSLGAGNSAKFKLSAVVGSIAGLTLNGPVSWTGNESLTSDVDLEAPSFAMSGGGCYAAGTCAYYGGLSVKGNAKLCKVTFWGDTDNIFDVIEPADLSLPASFSIQISADLTPAQKATYATHPYGLKATVWTSLGVKTYQSAPSILLDDFTEGLECGADNIKRKVSCLVTREWPWEKYLWHFYPEYWMDRLDDVVVEVRDRAGRTLDAGYVHQTHIDVVRDRAGLAQSMTLRASAYPGVGGGNYVSQPLNLSLRVPTAYRALSNSEIIARAYGNGLSVGVALSAPQLPAQAIGGTFQVNMSQAKLQDALR